MNARPKLDSVDLYNDLAHDRTWNVRMPNGATRAMTIEELDAAFDKAEIGLTTLVQRPSGGEWRTLGEAAGVDDSIRPVSSDFELVDIPKPPPLPRMAAADASLSDEELATVVPARKSGRRLAAVAMIGLLVGGVVAWRYMPAKPMTALATTTIMAPHSPAAAAAPPTPAPMPAPASEPAPDGERIAEQTVLGSIPNAIKGAKPIKSTAKPKTKTTWKQRLKLHSKTKKHA